MARGTAGKGKARSKPLPRTEAARVPADVAPPKRDLRRWVIYPALCFLFATTQAILIWKVVPNRLPSANFHLWTLPILTYVLGIATLHGGKIGWKIAIGAGSLALLSGILLIVRIIISAAFLSGVYGAFGKAAAMTALTSVALLVELVALLPLFQLKYLMSRAGRKAMGIA
jgi:hypothetical protein